MSTFNGFTPPFRTDNFLSHLRDQHASQWDELCNCNEKSKKSFFDVQFPFVETIAYHFGAHEPPLVLDMCPTIIDKIVKPMLLTEGSLTSSLGPYIKYQMTGKSYHREVKNRRLFNTFLIRFLSVYCSLGWPSL